MVLSVAAGWVPNDSALEYCIILAYSASLKCLTDRPNPARSKAVLSHGPSYSVELLSEEKTKPPNSDQRACVALTIHIQVVHSMPVEFRTERVFSFLLGQLFARTRG